jgi:hypothetical protein
MKIYVTLFVLTLLLFSTSGYSQQGSLQVIQDEKITELLRIKTNLSKENKISDGFTIQLFNGELKEANTIIRDYNRTTSTWSATIEYETPNYKVWVGNYVTRLEADRALLEIQKNFPNAFVLRPERRN